ncbi:hypothetical protein ACFPPA_05705 [Rhodanobacter ginsengisoli]|uniref:Uncharacterized protein n=1 Tax=Rhodanobacter ginsengisoli TaxID=418646 RepID=A0ABW0QR35_9GAMM
MNWLLYVIGALFIVRGMWLIPTTEREARYRQAPYRALRGAIYVLYGTVAVLIACGLKAAVVLAP